MWVLDWEFGCGVSLREAALSTAATEVVLCLDSAFPKTSAQLLILVGLQPMVGAGPSQRFFELSLFLAY